MEGRCGRGGGRGRPHRPGQQPIQDVETRQELERALREPRLHVTDGAVQCRRLEPLVGKPRTGRANVLGDTGRPCRRADDPE